MSLFKKVKDVYEDYGDEIFYQEDCWVYYYNLDSQVSKYVESLKDKDFDYIANEVVILASKLKKLFKDWYGHDRIISNVIHGNMYYIGLSSYIDENKLIDILKTNELKS